MISLKENVAVKKVWFALLKPELQKEISQGKNISLGYFCHCILAKQSPYFKIFFFFGLPNQVGRNFVGFQA